MLISLLLLFDVTFCVGSNWLWELENSYHIFLCCSFPRKRERTKYSSQGEDSVERSDGDRLTLPVPTRRGSFLYKSDSEFELASKCVTSRHHSFSEGLVNCLWPLLILKTNVWYLYEGDKFLKKLWCYEWGNPITWNISLESLHGGQYYQLKLQCSPFQAVTGNIYRLFHLLYLLLPSKIAWNSWKFNM